MSDNLIGSHGSEKKMPRARRIRTAGDRIDGVNAVTPKPGSKAAMIAIAFVNFMIVSCLFDTFCR